MPKITASSSLVIQLPFGSIDAYGLIVERKPTVEEIAGAWRLSLRHRRAMQWGIGDLYNLFVDGYSDAQEVADALDLAEISLATAQRYGHTCRRFQRCDDPTSEYWPFRRRDLSFSHHSAVAGLIGKSDEATALAVSLLDRAEADRTMSAEDLEDAVRTFRAAGAEAAGRAPSEGSPIARLERLHSEGEKVLKGLPSGWPQERELVTSALALISTALDSARNREIGGMPADVLLTADQEVIA